MWNGSKWVSVGSVQPPKMKKIIRHYNKLTWPQNAGNRNSEDLNFKTFSGKDAPGPP